MNTDAPLLYDIPAAALKLSVARRTLERLISEGAIETVKIGRSRRIPAEALADYIDELRKASA